MGPVVDGLRQQYDGRIDFDVHADVNSDAEGSSLAREHGVQAVPTMMLSDATGREIERWVGSVPADTLAGAFDAALR